MEAARLDGAAQEFRLQWGHGREAMDGAVTAAANRRRYDFNGAMAVRPWMEFRLACPPSMQSNFNGAMAVRPWMAGTI